MVENFFDLQRFAATPIGILAGETYKLDGVTYTAISDSQLNIDDNGKVSGIASGKVKATVTDKKNSPTITLDATNGATNFTATSDGKVFILTKVLPFELDNGTFTLAGNVLTAAKGSDLKIGNGRTYADGSIVFGHDYADTDIKYTITDTTLTEETERETIIFTASLGEKSRSITTVVSGKIINGVANGKFTGGFTITKDSSMSLILGDYIVKATANSDATSQVSVNSKGINITPGSSDGTLNVALSRGGQEIFAGELECTSGEITFGYDRTVTFTKGTSFNFTWNDYVSTVTATGDATTAIALTDNGISFTPGTGDGGLNLLLRKGGTPIFAGELNITGGTITFDATTQKFSFTEGTKISLGIGDGSQEIDFEVIGGDASFKIEADEKGNFTITPDKNDGKLDIALKRNGETVFQNTLSVDGSMIINPATDLLTLKNGTTISLAFNNYELTATATGDAASTISLTANGISITPQKGDGTLKLTLSSAGGSMSADIEILNGGFLFGTDGALSVTEGTELKIKFSDDYIVNFKATDAAGGAISIGADGITFKPNSSDGGLQLSITRNGETRSASLDVTGGSVTYKLDGSISLTKGTVVKNIFEDGNILTITANTDASGSIVFSPQTGLTITPATADALNVSLTTGDLEVVKITSITGTINYSGGIVTASDGTEIYVNYYDEYSSTVKTTGGTASVQFGTDRTIYTANESATLDFSYNDGSTIELQGVSTLTDIFNGTAILSEGSTASSFASDGSTFDPNDGASPLTLEKAGNYTLNGMKVTTTSDNVEVHINLDVIIVDGITYSPLDENVTLIIGENITTCTGGKVIMQMDGFNKSLTFDTTDGSISYDSSSNAFLISTAADLVALAKRVNNGDDCTGLTFKLTNDIDMSSIGNFTPIGNYFSYTNYKAFNGTFDGGGYTISNLTINHPNETNQALFGNVDYDATIQNLNIVNAKVTGYKDVGGVVGRNGGNLVNCIVSDSTVESKQENGGGIAGDNEGAINSCRAINTTVNGKYSVGGLVGDNDGIIGNSYVINPTVTTVSPDVENARLGAVVGDNSGTIEAYCYGGGSLARVGKNTGTDGSKEITDPTEIPGGIEPVQLSAGKFTVTAGTTLIVPQNEQVITLTASEGSSVAYKLEGGIYYFNFGNDAAANVSVTSNGQTVFSGGLEIGGVFSYRPDTGTFGLTGANSSHGSGKNTFAELTTANGYGLKMSTNDTTIVFIPKLSDGKFEVNFPNKNKHAMKFTVSKDGNTTFEGKVVIDGTIGFDVAKQELSLTKDTVLTLVGDGGNDLEIKALDDAGGQLTFTDGGIRFAPNAGDGQLELNFVAANRKANLDISSGAIIFGEGGKISLEKGTVANIEWEDGVKLKITASDTGGSIGFDEQGLKVSSNGELSIDLTAGDLKTQLSNLSGTIHYNAGKVLFDENSTLTATSTLGGQPVDITLESNGTGGYIEISANGTNYVAGTGALQVTWSRDGKESTFSFRNGSAYIGHGIFKIAEGTELSTDLKDLVPALYFTTTDAGTYTINGQIITTSAPNLALTATDDYMTFKTSDDVVTYKGMTLAGNGNVSLSSDSVVLGAGVVAEGFGEGKSFVLTEKGSVTFDGKIFELTEDVPLGMTIESADGGYTFSHEITQEEVIKNNAPSDYIGKVFSEKILVENDGTYTLRADSFGLQKAIGISDGAKLLGGYTNVDGNYDDKYAQGGLHLYVETDTEGDFTIGKKTYNISGDSNVEIKAMFLPEKSYASGFASLDGTVSGNFEGDEIYINHPNDILLVYNDDDFKIIAGANGAELRDISGGAILASYGGISKVYTDTTGDFTFITPNVSDSLAVTVVNDSNVLFNFNTDNQFITSIESVDGSLMFSEAPSDSLEINGVNVHVSGEFSSIGAYTSEGGVLFFHDVADGSEFYTEDEKKIWLQMRGETMTLNGNELTLTADSDGIWIRDKEIVGLDEGASLQVSEAGTYKTAAATLNAKAGDIIVGLADDDAYIYDENNPLFTRKTPTEEIVDYFKPNESYIISEDDRGQFNITLEGGDLAVVENTTARVNITAGDDTIVSQGEHVKVTLTPETNTWLFPTGGKMTLENYDHSTNSGFGTTYSDIAAAVESGKISFGNGKITMGAAEIDMGKRAELMNFFDRTGNKQVVGFAEHNTELDASNETNDLILVGGFYSSLTGGSGDDTIYGGAGSFVDAGAGDNLIKLKPADERHEYDRGATINIVKGSNTVENFNTGFDYESDVIENSSKVWDNVFDGENITINSDGGTTILEDIGNGEDFVTFKESANGSTYNVAITQEDSTIAMGKKLADVYIGKNSGVDFTGYDGALMVDLENKRGTARNGNVYFYGINKLTAGGGLTSLIGSSGDETLTAGKGYTSIWGSAGNDILIGNGESADKNGSTTFFFLKGDDHDSIYDFNFLTAENERTADKIDITAANAVTDVQSSGNDVVLQINNSDEDHLIIKDAVGKNFRINNLIAKVDKNISYDGLANCYVATSGSSLMVDSSVGSAEIWLDNSHGEFFLGDIRTLDASAVEGKTSLVGNAFDNTIRAGQGDSSLWGGLGDDLLQGGASKNTFFYASGDGFDTITGVNDGDVVNLADISLEQIAGTNITSAGVSIRFGDGGSLTVNGTADVTYQLADGSRYSANHSQGEWNSK